MQNNEHSNPHPLRKFFQEKGYYIVLFLCILAVGISGYLFLSDAVSEKNSLNDETLSVATTAKTPESPAQSQSPTRPAETVKPSMQAMEETSADEPEAQEEPVLSLQELARQAAASIRVWPLNGSSICGYSMEALAYNVTTQDWRTHDGVDLAAEPGTRVKAAGYGTVTAVYDDAYYGTTVVICHTDGSETHYSNLSAETLVEAGDAVNPGDVIGTVGETALLEAGEAAHLHFAVYRDGRSVDPADFLG